MSDDNDYNEELEELVMQGLVTRDEDIIMQPEGLIGRAMFSFVNPISRNGNHGFIITFSGVRSIKLDMKNENADDGSPPHCVVLLGFEDGYFASAGDIFTTPQGGLRLAQAYGKWCEKQPGDDNRGVDSDD